MTIPCLYDGEPYFSYDCYTWCHPREMDFGDLVNLDHLLFAGAGHLQPFYLNCFCSLAHALNLCPTYLPESAVSHLSALPHSVTVEEASDYYGQRLKGFLHPKERSIFSGPPSAVYNDLLPLRSSLLGIIGATNWRGEGGNNVPMHFETWQDQVLSQKYGAFFGGDLPKMKCEAARRIEEIDELVFQGLFPGLAWQRISLHELRTRWGYPSPSAEAAAFEA